MKKNILYLLILISLTFNSAFAEQGEMDPTVLYNKGIDYYEQNKIEESIATFKKAIALDSEFYEAYYNLARILESSGKTKEAVSYYEKLLEISPDDYESRYQYAQLLYKNGYLSKAALNLKKIPTNSEFKPGADKLIAKIELRQKELKLEAEVKAKQALKSVVVANIPTPSGLVVDSGGNIYVASFSDNKILKFSNNLEEKSIFADKQRGLDGPIGLGIDSNDNIYVSNYNKGNVLVFNKDGSDKVLMYTKKPYGLLVDQKKNKVYVTEQGTNSIIQYDISDVSPESSVIESAEIIKSGETRVISTPKKDRTPIGVPSIIESNYSRQNPQSSITAPIMVPAGSGL